MDTLNLSAVAHATNNNNFSIQDNNMQPNGDSGGESSMQRPLQCQPATPRPSISAATAFSSSSGGGGGGGNNSTGTFRPQLYKSQYGGNAAAQQPEQQANGLSNNTTSAENDANNNNNNNIFQPPLSNGYEQPQQIQPQQQPSTITTNGQQQQSNGGGGLNLSHLSLPVVLHFIQSEWARFDMERNQWEALQAEMEARIALLQGERTSLDKLKNDLVRRIKMLECALRQERMKNVRLAKQNEMLMQQQTAAPPVVNSSSNAPATSAVATAPVDIPAAADQQLVLNPREVDAELQALKQFDSSLAQRVNKMANPAATITALMAQHQHQQQQQQQQAAVAAASLGGNGNNNNGAEQQLGGAASASSAAAAALASSSTIPILSSATTTTAKDWDFIEGRFVIQQYLKELNYTDNIINIRTARLRALLGGDAAATAAAASAAAAVAGGGVNRDFIMQPAPTAEQQHHQQQNMHASSDSNFNNRQQQQQEQQRQQQQHGGTDENDAETDAALREFEFLSDNSTTNNYLNNPLVRDAFSSGRGNGDAGGVASHTTTASGSGVGGGEWPPMDGQRIDQLKTSFIQDRLAQHHHQAQPGGGNKGAGQKGGSRRETLVNANSNRFEPIDNGAQDSAQQQFNNNNIDNNPNTGDKQQQLHAGGSGGGGGITGNSSLVAIDMEDDDADDMDDNNTDNVFGDGGGGGGLNGEGGGGGGLESDGFRIGPEFNSGGSSSRNSGGGGGGNRRSTIGKTGQNGRLTRGSAIAAATDSSLSSSSSASATSTGDKQQQQVFKWRAMYALGDHVDCVRSIAFHPQRDETSFVTCSDDCTVKLWTLWTTSPPPPPLPLTTTVSGDDNSIRGYERLLACMPPRHTDFGPYLTLKLHEYPVIACAYAASSANKKSYNLLFTADISGCIRAWNLERLMPTLTTTASAVAAGGAAAGSEVEQPQCNGVAPANNKVALVQKNGLCNDMSIPVEHLQAAHLVDIHTDAVWTLIYLPAIEGGSNSSNQLLSVDCQTQLVIWSISTTSSESSVAVDVVKQFNIRELCKAYHRQHEHAAADDTDSDAAVPNNNNNVAVVVGVDSDELVGVVLADETYQRVLACFRSSGCYLVHLKQARVVEHFNAFNTATTTTSATNNNANNNGSKDDDAVDPGYQILSCTFHAPHQLAAVGHRNGKVTLLHMPSSSSSTPNNNNSDDADRSGADYCTVAAVGQWQAQLQDVVTVSFSGASSKPLLLVTGAADGAIRLWGCTGSPVPTTSSTTTTAIAAEQPQQHNRFQRKSVLPVSSHNSNNNWKCIQDVKESRPKFNEAVTSVCIHKHQPMFASGSADGVVRIYTPF